MKFKHPGDAMRAKIEGKLTCASCAAYEPSETDQGDEYWCRRKKHAPVEGAAHGEQVCEDFFRCLWDHDVNPGFIPKRFFKNWKPYD